MRPSRDDTFLAIAHVLAARGTCDRKKVGAVITRDGRCVSWGYNGAPPGLPHCDEVDHGFKDILDITGPDQRTREERADILIAGNGCRNATHAEANALAFAARQGIPTVNGTCYVTVSPCDVCARLLLAAGIKEVVYAEEYRDARGIEILRAARVACRDGGRYGRISRTEG